MWDVTCREGAQLVTLQCEKSHGVSIVADKFHLVSHAFAMHQQFLKTGDMHNTAWAS